MKLTIAAAALAAVTLLQQTVVVPRGGMTIDQARRLAQPIGAEPIEVLDLERVWAGVEPLMQLATSRDVSAGIRTAAMRALGRLENPQIVPQLLALPRQVTPPGPRADAVAQSLQGFDPANDPDLVRRATVIFLAASSQAIVDEISLGEVLAMAQPLSRMRHVDAAAVHGVEAVLLKVLAFTSGDARRQGAYVAAVRNFESLARINQRTTALDEDSAVRLRRIVARTGGNDIDEARLYAFMALNSGRSLDPDTIKEALDDGYWQVRRMAATVVAGAGGGLDDQARINVMVPLLEDTSPQVRYEAVRAFARRGAATLGCAPLEAAARDQDLHVALAAIDALGDACKADAELTERLAAQTQIPPPTGSWHRGTHSFVALAKRSPELVAPMMEAFVTHPVWWVRMYAAGAAAAAVDLLHLEKLVFDTHDNVREAALGPWRRLKKADADPAIVDALERMDVQLLRTAASLAKDSVPAERNYKALMGALARLTKEGKETSRDARIMILEAIAIQGAAANANELVPYLRDFDPKVADKAADLIGKWTGRRPAPEPVPYPRGWSQAYKDLTQCVAVQMSDAGTFRLKMEPSAAPLTVDRFLKLALKDQYYNGLTIHRVVPNFVLQGGSPNANEYAGAKEYMRDEISGRNVRGTVGLSTRGRNTADAQFFINLVDNPRLNGDYTVFARVLEEDLRVIDRVYEGDLITSVTEVKCVPK